MIRLFIFLLMLACAGAGVQSVRLSNEQVAHQKTKADHAIHSSRLERATRELSEKYRIKEQEIAHAAQANASKVAALRVDLQRARAAGDMAAKRLRDATKAFADRARAQCANTAASELRPSTDDPIGVLAHVLGRADARAGELADVAEQRGIAGRACEREYNSIQEALKEMAQTHSAGSNRSD